MCPSQCKSSWGWLKTWEQPMGNKQCLLSGGRQSMLMDVLSWRQLHQLKELLSSVIASMLVLAAELVLPSCSAAADTAWLCLCKSIVVEAMNGATNRHLCWRLRGSSVGQNLQIVAFICGLFSFSLLSFFSVLGIWQQWKNAKYSTGNKDGLIQEVQSAQHPCVVPTAFDVRQSERQLPLWSMKKCDQRMQVEERTSWQRKNTIEK